MRCPRCDGPLTTYALDDADRSAVVCERCGYADVPASHRSDVGPGESWDDAIDRFEEDNGESLARLQRVSESVSTPAETERTTIDGAALEETGVSVGTALGESSTADDEDDEELRLVGADAPGPAENSRHADGEASETPADPEEAASEKDSNGEAEEAGSGSGEAVSEEGSDDAEPESDAAREDPEADAEGDSDADAATESDRG